MLRTTLRNLAAHKLRLLTTGFAVLLGVAFMSGTMILSATWLWFFVVRGDLDLIGSLGTANRGELVQPPIQIADAGLTDPGGSPFTYSGPEAKWTMVIPGANGRCDSICENNLYTTRQIHVALGKDFNRIRRVYINETGPADTQLTVQELSDNSPAPGSFATFLADEHRGLIPLLLESKGVEELFAKYRTDPGTWYLVDPAGWIMMSYNQAVSYKDVIADIKFLLKNSGD